LRVVANYAVGYNNIDLEAATAHGVAAANTPDVLTESTADLAWAILMATARRLGEAERYLRDGQWRGWAPLLFLGVDVYGKTLGVFGMGRIGQAFARRAKGFGMRVLYTNRSRVDAAIERELGAEFVDMTTLLQESDFLSLHCPLTEETRHAFGTAEFAAMKPTACLINTARGAVVNEEALAGALEQRQLFAAGLDVFEEEPEVHPKLLACPHAVLVPHLGSSTEETRSRMGEVAAANIISRLEGKPPPNWLNPEAGE
jgi:glyoxylate reductase